MPADSPRAWQVVLESIESDLLAEALQPGDHLPPERTLAASLGVGRSSVREAIRVLEVLGLIRTQTGSGPQAGAIVVATPSGGMSNLMRLQVAANGFPISDIVQTRLILESSTVRALATAAASGSDADLSDAAQLLETMADPALTEAEFLALDAQFHLALAEASGNLVITAMMAGLRGAIESYVLAAVPHLGSWAETCARLRAEHQSILTAILAGEPADAAAGIHTHITRYYAESGLSERTPPDEHHPHHPQQKEPKHG
jgi:GntR family transcriptional regulator, transcriptional repressor for pyruvate dehydrogenase complex